MQTEALIARLSADRVYKLLRKPEWQALQRSGATRGSTADERDGYVHLSTAAQLAGTLERHFADARDLWLLRLDPLALGGALRWEPSRGGALFPHLYGLLQLPDCSVVATRSTPESGWVAAVSA